MPKLHDLAHYGHDDARIETPRAAWLVWSAMYSRRIGGADNTTHEIKQGIDGVLYVGSLRSILREMCPGVKEFETLAQDVSKYLRETGNAQCKRHAKGSRAVWWVRSDWYEAPVAVINRFRYSRTERRLSRHESGEDRPPTPVTTLHARQEEQEGTDVDEDDFTIIDTRWLPELHALDTAHRSTFMALLVTLHTLEDELSNAPLTRAVKKTTKTKMHTPTTSGYMQTVRATGLVTAKLGGGNGRGYLWCINDEQRKELGRVIDWLRVHRDDPVDRTAVMNTMLDVLADEEWHGMKDFTDQFIAATRAYNALNRIEVEGYVLEGRLIQHADLEDEITVRDGGETGQKQWRLVPAGNVEARTAKQSTPEPESDPVPTDVDITKDVTDAGSITEAATLIESLVVQRTQALRAEVATLTEQRDAALQERDRLQTRLDEIAKLMGTGGA